MKVLHVCFSDNVGGAFIGAHRLHTCMVVNGIDSELLVIKKRTDDPRVIPSPIGLKLQNFIYRKLARVVLWTQYTPDTEHRSLNLFPTTINRLINSHDADIIQLHWVGNNTIGISEFSKINKPIVWKLADMWAFCGCEHYTEHHDRYQEGYTRKNRPQSHRGLDIDRYCWELKRKHWKNLNLTIVCPSKWLADCASRSYLLKNCPVYNIPNPIDTEIFRPANDRNHVRQKLGLPANDRLILFSSLAKASYSRKGFDQLEKCIEIFSSNKDKSVYKIVIMGRDIQKNDIHGVKVINLGMLTEIDEIAQAYTAMDTTLVPSTADNLPNVIKESMACGIPCISYDTGGVPEMISHKENGYLAAAGNCKELAEGLEWVFSSNRDEIGSAARNSAVKLHGHKFIVEQYARIYESLIRYSSREPC